MAYKGIIFDFDGVIVDSETHWPSLDQVFLAENVPAWNEADYSRLIGMSLPEIHRFLVKTYGMHMSAQEFSDQYELLASRMYEMITKPLPGITDLLKRLKEVDVPLGIASSSKPAWIQSALKRYNLLPYFSTIVTAYDPAVKKGKPAPDVYMQASIRLGENPQHLIAIEDSANGVKAAKAAGLYCIGLRNGFNEGQDLSSADDTTIGYPDNTISKICALLTQEYN